MNRREILNQYKKKPQVSILIIGAGVNGIGTFLDLANQGIDVLIIDRGDFCSGVSAASSHMIHGGIRYLENGEFRLVKEAIQERNRLLDNAPHYVKPLPTVIPIYKWFSGLFNAPMKFLGLMGKPSERGVIVIKIGLALYELYSGGQASLPKHIFQSRSASQREFPKINPDILFTARYYDAAMLSPERICIEMILDGENANNDALGLNYVSVQSASGNILNLKDQLSNQVFSVQPKVVINAAGPWIDFVNNSLGIETQFIGGTKGSHIILENTELREEIGENEIFFENKDGRIVLIYPLRDKVLVGSTDIPFNNPDKAVCTDDEIEYFIEMVNFIFPSIIINKEQIIFKFSGVRPLPTSDSTRTGQISRDHSIREVENGKNIDFPILSLIGGKWTTYRSFSEEATNRSLEILGAARKVSTTNLEIGGGQNYPDNPDALKDWIDSHSMKTGLSTERVATLFNRYGTRASKFLKLFKEYSDTPLPNLTGFSEREIRFIARKEKVVHLDDFILRRSQLAKMGELSREGIVGLAEIIGDELSWSKVQRAEEISRAVSILGDRHGVLIEKS
jgi:glycerol-3-phosphate dehydrogenase